MTEQNTNKIKSRPRIYICCEYTGKTQIELDKNIKRAAMAAAELIDVGWAPFCPYLNTTQLDGYQPEFTHSDYMSVYLAWLRVTDAAFLLSGYEHSDKTKTELEYLRNNCIPVIYQSDPHSWRKLEDMRRNLVEISEEAKDEIWTRQYLQKAKEVIGND